MAALILAITINLLIHMCNGQGFSPQLQEAIDFCGGLQSLTDGLCPDEGPVDDSKLNREFLPAKNIKLCKARDTPGLVNPSESWKSTQLKLVKLNAHFNATSGRYGLGGKPLLLQIDFVAPTNINNMAGRAVGLLPELPRKESFERDLCNPFLTNPCTIARGGSRCPATSGSTVNFVATMPFSGSYKRGLPVDLRVELYNTDAVQNNCVTKDTLSNFGEPIICFLIQGYIL